MKLPKEIEDTILDEEMIDTDIDISRVSEIRFNPYGKDYVTFIRQEEGSWEPDEPDENGMIRPGWKWCSNCRKSSYRPTHYCTHCGSLNSGWD